MKVAKNPDMVKQLRQDRAAIVELLKLPVDKETTEATPATEVAPPADVKADIEIIYPSAQTAPQPEQRVLGTAVQTPSGETQINVGGGNMLPVTSDQMSRAGLAVVNNKVIVQDPVKFSNFKVGL